jgi:hypothetical protein
MSFVCILAILTSTLIAISSFDIPVSLCSLNPSYAHDINTYTNTFLNLHI